MTGVTVVTPSRAQEQDPGPSEQQNQQQQAQQQTPSQQQRPAPPPPAPASSGQAQPQPGLTTKEQQNVEHEKKTGTSKDRIFWILPNFLSIENVDNLPSLTPGQKFKAVGRGLIDPFEFGLIGVVAGLGQASNSIPEYGQGAEGYGKRYATAYADNAVENFMASAVLPSFLHQDPRYYQLGHGGFLRRAGHAISRLVVTRTDSGGSQFNYSEVFGAGIAAGISTYSYHPNGDRGVGTVINVWGSQMGWDCATYMLKEFWPDLRRIHEKKSAQAQP
ncbi:MAG TPA: hypothetical protein VEJ46_02595 [Candidatus Acidoferrum sp.]|nr:hypothetical protein [Candidatus Acidoferrum sp.]